jgi:N-acetylglucosamine-6-phosphate deacetylase
MSIPGWIDLQVNGYDGVNFSDPSLTMSDIEKVSILLLEKGTIAYCPTLISSSLDAYKHNLTLISKAMDIHETGAKILGVHLEGPFINPEKGYRGIHREENILSPSIEIYNQLKKWSRNKIALITLAPELPGAIELINHIKEGDKTIVSIGHSKAGENTIQQAVKKGVQAATHVGNGLPDLIPRHDNPIWPLLADDELFGLFITDGFHLPKELVKTCLRAKGASKFIVTSDLIHIGGKKPGNYLINDSPVVLEPNGHLHVQDSSQLAGSASSMMECMNFLASIGELTVEELIQIGHDNPLNLLKSTIEQEIVNQKPIISFEKNKFLIKSNSV